MTVPMNRVGFASVWWPISSAPAPSSGVSVQSSEEDEPSPGSPVETRGGRAVRFGDIRPHNETFIVDDHLDVRRVIYRKAAVGSERPRPSFRRRRTVPAACRRWPRQRS